MIAGALSRALQGLCTALLVMLTPPALLLSASPTLLGLFVMLRYEGTPLALALFAVVMMLNGLFFLLALREHRFGSAKKWSDQPWVLFPLSCLMISIPLLPLAV